MKAINKFNYSISTFITQNMGGILINKTNDKEVYEINTIVGKLVVTLRSEESNVYCIFAKFKDVELAKQKFNCNPYSGKYNFLSEQSLQKSIESAKIHLETVQN